MQINGHKTCPVFERDNIMSECDVVGREEAQRAATRSLPPEGESHTSDRDGLAATKPRSDEVGHNSGTVGADRRSRLSVSLQISSDAH
jgi:hypothetical protein